MQNDAHRTLTEQAYTQLRDDIIEGHLAPGTKLRIEHLRQRYAVGAGTLREAVTRLASDALIISEGQRGFWVAPMSIPDLLDLTQVRCQLELEALRQSIQRNQNDWRERVKRSYAAMTAIETPQVAQQDRKAWEQCNSAFHEALISGADSPWTLRILQTLSRQSERYRRLSMKLPNSGRKVHAEHQLIYEAVMAAEAARAALALEMHIRATPDLILRAWRSGLIDQQGQLSAAALASSGQAPWWSGAQGWETTKPDAMAPLARG